MSSSICAVWFTNNHKNGTPFFLGQSFSTIWLTMFQPACHLFKLCMVALSPWFHTISWALLQLMRSTKTWPHVMIFSISSNSTYIKLPIGWNKSPIKKGGTSNSMKATLFSLNCILIAGKQCSKEHLRNLLTGFIGPFQLRNALAR